jgi:hypothetical protein
MTDDATVIADLPRSGVGGRARRNRRDADA